jgi:hypothetical protein
MLVVEKSIALNEAVQQMGFESIEEFALAKAKEEVLEEIAICNSRIEKFEQKYGCDYGEFCSGFHELQQQLFEKEEDSGEWKAELKQLNILQKRLVRLS